MRFKAAIFDVDGTLVDLLEDHWRAFNEICEKHFDASCPLEDFKKVYGKPSTEIFDYLLSEAGIDPGNKDIASLAEERREIFRAGLGDVKPLPGVSDLLDAIEEDGTPIAVATSSEKRNGHAIIEAAGLADRFPVFVTRTDVARGKPHPDLFLRAAELLGFDSEDCVVFEDSTHGVTAAKKAGATVVAVTTGSHSAAELAQRGGDLVVASLADPQVRAFLGL